MFWPKLIIVKARVVVLKVRSMKRNQGVCDFKFRYTGGNNNLVSTTLFNLLWSSYYFYCIWLLTWIEWAQIKAQYSNSNYQTSRTANNVKVQ